MVVLWFCILFARCPSHSSTFSTLIIGINLRFCLCKYHSYQHILILCRLHTVKPIFTDGRICPASHGLIGNQVHHIIEGTVKHKTVFIIFLFCHSDLLFFLRYILHLMQNTNHNLLSMQDILRQKIPFVNTFMQDFLNIFILSCILIKFTI